MTWNHVLVVTEISVQIRKVHANLVVQTLSFANMEHAQVNVRPVLMALDIFQRSVLNVMMKNV